MLREKIMAELKTAMLAKETARVDAIRLIMAALKQKDIDARPSGVANGISDEQILSMMQGMVKQRRESIVLYEQGNRPELAAKELAEINVIEQFLPQQMDDAAMQAAIAALVTKLGASSVKDMGRVMAELKTAYAGQMDFTKASSAVKQALS